jgi:hypothetical protein
VAAAGTARRHPLVVNGDADLVVVFDYEVAGTRLSTGAV